VQGLARSVIEETITHFLREAGVEERAEGDDDASSRFVQADEASDAERRTNQ
jgi:hypothetical protein